MCTVYLSYSHSDTVLCNSCFFPVQLKSYTDFHCVNTHCVYYNYGCSYPSLIHLWQVNLAYIVFIIFILFFCSLIFFLALSCIVQSIRHEANALFLFFPSKALIAKLITQYKVPKNPKLTTHMLQTHITHCPVLWRSCATLWTNESTHIHKDFHH